MELRQLRYFVVLVEERHFGRAAERLHIAQPGLSQQIKALERSLGAVLFDRDSRPVELTESGRRLLPYARSIVEAASRASEAVRSGRSNPGPALEVGVPAIGHYPEFASLVETYAERQPEVELRVTPSMTPAMLEALHRRTLDVAAVHQPFDWIHGGEPPRYLRIGEREMVIVVPEDHELASFDRLSHEQLLGEQLVSPPDGSWGTIADHAHRVLFGVPRHPNVVEIPGAVDAESRVQLVAEGRGFAMVSLPAYSELPVRRGVAYRRVQGPPALAEYGLAWFETNASPAVRSFVDLARELQRAEHG